MRHRDEEWYNEVMTGMERIDRNRRRTASRIGWDGMERKGKGWGRTGTERTGWDEMGRRDGTG